MTDEKFSDLDKRVDRLETYFRVGLIVAAVFGIGGGFGAFLLNSARTEIAALEQSVSTLTTNVGSLKADVVKAQTDLEIVTSTISEAVAEHLSTLESAKSKHLSAIDTASQDTLTAISKRATTLEDSLTTSVGNELSVQLSATIGDRLAGIESELALHKVLAVVTVIGSRLVTTKSTTGVRYNRQNGVVTFPNPDNAEYLVVVSDYGTAREELEYRTDTNFLRSQLSSTEFRVWKTTLDTTDRNGAPNGFTAIIIKVDGS